MSEIPSLVEDIALILVVAGIVTLLFKKLKQPLVLGYVVAGFLVSPNFPLTVSVVDKADIAVWAEIGVMFLLFSLGLDFSFKKIVKMGIAPIIAALTIVISMMFSGYTVGHLFGWTEMNCIFLGGMLAMSSTTIIYKAFDDLSLRQQNFASLVMSVLILEDVLAIVLMVVLSAMASGGGADGKMMMNSILNIGFFLILWFVVGLFVIPLFLRKVRPLMTSETLLIVSLGLCCLMAVISTKVGFSAAFGAFVMGSILAETVEADKIEKVVEPVKNLFGAIFFVSVGMLVDYRVLIEYAVPTLVIVLAIIVSQSVFGTIGYLMSGQTLKTAMRCGFSMAQIGEFAFIIAGVGQALGVIGDFIYPVVVAVSVITTFLTPYMIRGAVPAYDFLEKKLPPRVIATLNGLTSSVTLSRNTSSNWDRLLKSLLLNTVIYTILSIAVIALMLMFFLPFIRSILPHWWANGVCGVLTVMFISPFIRAMVMKKNKSEEFKELWMESRHNRFPLVFTIVFRALIAIAMVFYLCNYLSRFSHAIMLSIALIVLIAMVMSRRLKNSSIRMERLFMLNLRSREIAAQASGKKRPLFEGHLLDRNLHIGQMNIPVESTWGGKTLKELRLGQRFGVSVSSIIRGSRRINIPSGNDMIFPGDCVNIIGDDEQLSAINAALLSEVYPDDFELERHEMKLERIIITSGHVFLGKTLMESGMRDKYNCMLVGMEEDDEKLSKVRPDYEFQLGDVIWIVGEKNSVYNLID